MKLRNRLFVLLCRLCHWAAREPWDWKVEGKFYKALADSPVINSVCGVHEYTETLIEKRNEAIRKMESEGRYNNKHKFPSRFVQK